MVAWSGTINPSGQTVVRPSGPGRFVHFSTLKRSLYVNSHILVNGACNGHIKGVSVLDCGIESKQDGLRLLLLMTM